MTPRTSSHLRSAPAHGRLVDDLRQAIVAGKLAAGDRISGEVALAGEYGISVTSVRRGIDVLVKEGMLRRRQGSGTYVTAHHHPLSAPPQALIRRDTIAIVSHVQPLTYHPYYSERIAGVRAGLSQLGWKLWEPESQEHGTGPAKVDFGKAPYAWNTDRLWAEIGQHVEFAGMIVRTSLLPKEADFRSPYPLVTPDDTDRLPSVVYRWQDEIERCMRALLASGPQRVWVLGVFAEAMIREAAQRAASALGMPLPELQIRHTTDRISSLSESVRHAYQEASTDFAQGVPDAVLVTSDFEAQGVIDALLSLGHGHDAPLRFAAIANKESRLEAPWPITKAVVDGYAHGLALADLLHRQIVEPARAPRRIILSGRLEFGA